VGAMHCFYYGVLFSPLYAELGGPHGHAIWTVASLARSSPLPYPMPEDLERALPLLAHYGLRFT
jgi:hypothetical protein